MVHRLAGRNFDGVDFNPRPAGCLSFRAFHFPWKTAAAGVDFTAFHHADGGGAAGFNALLGPRGWVNLALMSLLGLNAPPINLLNTLAVILLAHVFYNTSIVIRMVGTAWAQLDPKLEQAARTLGARSARAFFEITLPLLSSQFWRLRCWSTCLISPVLG